MTRESGAKSYYSSTHSQNIHLSPIIMNSKERMKTTKKIRNGITLSSFSSLRRTPHDSNYPQRKQKTQRLRVGEVASVVVH